MMRITDLNKKLVNNMKKIVISLPKLKKEIKTAGDVTLLRLLRDHDIPVANSCSGEAICGWCKVKIVDGIKELHPPTTDENIFSAKKGLKAHERLACQIWVETDLTIDTDYW
ncbi:MAG: 2Fe-2S iron-sulfur cluster-binding protein [Calditrichaceae bacterium]